MPELPEVEMIRRALVPELVGRRIASVEVRLPRLVRSPTLEDFTASLEDREFTAVQRRGKFLLLLVPPWALVSHLRMEGSYHIAMAVETLDKHTHMIFRLDDGRELRYRDVRTFGTFDLVPLSTVFQCPPLVHLGFEPLDRGWNWEDLRKILRNRRGSLKGFLLNQQHIAGLGNIYADETLFLARLHPLRRAGSLREDEMIRLHASIRCVLGRALRTGGTTVRSYRHIDGTMGGFQSALRVYGRAGRPCFHCRTPIEKQVIVGRGTHSCPRCQPPPTRIN